MADGLTEKIFNQGYMEDVTNDWYKVQAIMKRQHDLFLRALAAANSGDKRTLVGLLEELIECHVALRELWGIDDNSRGKIIS